MKNIFANSNLKIQKVDIYLCQLFDSWATIKTENQTDEIFALINVGFFWKKTNLFCDHKKNQLKNKIYFYINGRKK